ncbi:Aspartate aminotransferase [Alternaria alternata]|nr:Aspartate aminotransferase [Alternaria alternata]
MRRAPVPEMVWVTAMLSWLRGAESSPYASLRAALVKLGTPVMPAYSLSRVAVSLEGFGDTQNGLRRGGELSSDVSLRSCTYILDMLLALAKDGWGPIAFATYWRTLRYLRPSGDSSDAGPERQLLSRRLAQRRS